MKTTKFPLSPILLVDDEQEFLISASFALQSEGINNVEQCSESHLVMDYLSKKTYSLVLLDLVMPRPTGNELLPLITEGWPHIPVVVTTALNDVETAVSCMKIGASDYLVKPMDATRLATTVRKSLELGEIRNENILLKQYLLADKLEHPNAFAEIVTVSQSMRAIFQYMEAIAKTSYPVLITGETGVGKELIARALHHLSGCSGEFVTVNVAGVDDGLFSDTLFGHRTGAFTGADRDRKGLVEQAEGGTLFLDEIGDMHPESQVKLLRLLAERKYYPLGADMPKLSDARVVVATNRDLDAQKKNGSFRKDLYYRLQTHRVRVPPLRERAVDIPALVKTFLEKAAKILGKTPPTPPRELYTLLATYSFPGNIRELESMVFDAVACHRKGTLALQTFTDRMGLQKASNEILNIYSTTSTQIEKDVVALQFPPVLPGLKDLERTLIKEALKRAKGNQTIAAKLLGVSRRALNNRLSRTMRDLLPDHPI